MHIKLSFSYVVTFLLLLIVMLELHETVHIVVGRLICGCWGPRDFNVWSLGNGCPEHHLHWWLATLAGPLFSFALMWLGMVWLNTKESGKMTLGFSLIFANIPFGRISTVMMGGGDEMVVTRHFLKGEYSRTQMILICSVLVLGLGLPPIIKAFRVLTNRRSWLYITGFLTLPLLFLLIYVLIGLNTLLNNGFLATPWIMGTPVLITLHTSLALLALLWLRKNLFSINSNTTANS
ncbi:hypothetical protein BH09BAC4_BH09BAC4_11690 [soil metagenome]